MATPVTTGVGTSGTLWVQGAESKTRRADGNMGRDSKIYETVIKTASDAFHVFAAIITLILTRVPIA